MTDEMVLTVMVSLIIRSLLVFNHQLTAIQMGATEGRFGEGSFFHSVKLHKGKSSMLSVHLLGQPDLLQ
jgi:hypothetical protein